MHTVENPRILFVGGGSVGHIAPSVAVWNVLKKMQSNASAHFVCSPRPDDAPFLEANNVEHSILDAPRLSISFIWKYMKAKKEAAKILSSFNPDVVFSKGGYISIPLCAAAKQKGVPIVLHESDSVSGRANAIVSKWAKAICTGFPTQKTNTICTGNPVRSSIQNGSKEAGLQLTGFSGIKPILMVIGGSQGATSINDAIINLLPELLQSYDVIHITGREKRIDVQKDGYWSTEFVNEEIADLYAITDIAISRAGAGSIGELAANSIATILVPLRSVGHDHQQKNAEVIEDAGACIVLQQGDLNSKLSDILKEILNDKKKRVDLEEQIHLLHKEDAAEQIANTIVKCIA